ncbi:hypothetical protein DUI87_15684 [Hirundo rustica rustica]|uniref:Uncharacterized protein n=1 Tax=Hirundo rustica rustica TaxID=333673 RepID=A0A3M0JZB4_HIRRU|nr:hypothetical protein DUI87_15684 [Hirundo rustica rustica]
MGDKVMMNGMGEVIVSLKVREEKGKCKEKPAGLEEEENMQEGLDNEFSLERRVVLGYVLDVAGRFDGEHGPDADPKPLSSRSSHLTEQSS